MVNGIVVVCSERPSVSSSQVRVSRHLASSSFRSPIRSQTLPKPSKPSSPRPSNRPLSQQRSPSNSRNLRSSPNNKHPSSRDNPSSTDIRSLRKTASSPTSALSQISRSSQHENQPHVGNVFLKTGQRKSVSPQLQRTGSAKSRSKASSSGALAGAGLVTPLPRSKKARMSENQNFIQPQDGPGIFDIPFASDTPFQSRFERAKDPPPASNTPFQSRFEDVNDRTASDTSAQASSKYKQNLPLASDTPFLSRFERGKNPTATPYQARSASSSFRTAAEVLQDNQSASSSPSRPTRNANTRSESSSSNKLFVAKSSHAHLASDKPEQQQPRRKSGGGYFDLLDEDDDALLGALDLEEVRFAFHVHVSTVPLFSSPVVYFEPLGVGMIQVAI